MGDVTENEHEHGRLDEELRGMSRAPMVGGSAHRGGSLRREALVEHHATTQARSTLGIVGSPLDELRGLDPTVEGH
jgi:hypothetical protein